MKVFASPYQENATDGDAAMLAPGTLPCQKLALLRLLRRVTPGHLKAGAA